MTLNLSHLLAVGFVTWAFFWAGLAAVAIPIIIHILNRRRFKTVTWAAMDFLLRAMKKNRRRLRFEQWVLLATRCLVVFLLGIALARPLGCENQSVAGIGGRMGLNVFVIDNSYSMAYDANRAGDARTHLDQAKRIAKALMEQMNSGGESVVLITSSRPAAAVPGFEKPSYNLAAASSAVERIEQTHGATDVVGALQAALRVGRDEARQPVKNLYILSDATRSAWEAPGQADAMKALGHDLAKVFRVSHYNLAQGQQQWNQAALDLKPVANLVTTKFGTDFSAVLRGYGTGPDAAVAWSLNDTRLPDGPAVRLEADTAPVIQSRAPLKSGGPQVVSVSVTTNDPLDMDNTRWRVVDVASALKVLVVEGQRGVDALEGSGAFLQIALSPPLDAPGSGPASSRTSSYVSSELISDLELGNKVLGDYRAVILAGVGTVPATQAEALAQFVQQGGTLMVFMGEPVDSQNYNQVLLPRKLLPGPLLKRMQVASDQKGFVFDFNPKGVNHPLLREFANQENTGLDTAQVFTYWQVDPSTDLQVERVLNYRAPDAAASNNGAKPADPAITVHGLGQGRVVFFSTTANDDWASLAPKPVYVALMHELLAGSVRTGDGWLNLTAGQPLEVPPTVRLSATPTLVDSSKNPVVVEAADAGNGQTVYRSRPLNKPGVYTLNTGSGTYPVAVNVPNDEADVRMLSDEALRKAMGDVDVTFRGADVPQVAASREAGNDLSWAFMLAVFALLAIECFMAMRFGHHRRTDFRATSA
jgi:hypothetical protein